MGNGLKCDKKLAKRFFTSILWNTVWSKDPKIRQAAEKVGAFLEKRRAARIKNIGNPKGKLPPVPAELKPVVEIVSKTLLGRIKRYFTHKKKIDYNCLQQAFMWFANGELPHRAFPGNDPTRNPSIGRPDGRWFFNYAEFAFLCVELKIHDEHWKEAVKTMVKAQELYLSAFPPNDPVNKRDGEKSAQRRRDLDPKASASNNKKDKQGKTEKDKLHDKYKNKQIEGAGGLKEAHEENLKRLRDQLGKNEKAKPRRPLQKPPQEQKPPPPEKEREQKDRENASMDRAFDNIQGVLASLRWVISELPSECESIQDQNCCEHLLHRMNTALGHLEMITDWEDGTIPYHSRSFSTANKDYALPNQLPQYFRIVLHLESIHVQSKGIGSEWQFQIESNEKEIVHISEKIKNNETIYTDVEHAINHTSNREEESIHIPIVINATEIDPSYSDHGTIDGTIEITPDTLSGSQMISGTVEARKAERGQAQIEFLFNWTLYPLL